jgi:hypothetical protein
MSAVARWREIEGRMPGVRGRLPAAVAAVAGSLLAVATIAWPVMRIVQSSGMPGANSPYFVQVLWSWGRLEVEGVELDQRSVVNVAPAYWLGLACVAGLLGAVAWLLRRGADGRVLGSAGVAFALAVVGDSFVERLGNVALYDEADMVGVELQTLPAGRVEVAAAALLLLALVLMLWRPVIGLGRPLEGFARRVSARRRLRAAADDEAGRAASGEAPRVGRAVLRDVASPGDGSRRPGGDHGGVGFTDGAAADERFRPPSG